MPPLIGALLIGAIATALLGRVDTAALSAIEVVR